MWHCGSNCQTVAIVNAKNGRVHFPLSFAMSDGVVSEGTAIITDPIDAELMKDLNGTIPEWLKTRFFIGNGAKMTEIGNTR
jgi:hypothetical protein